MGYMYIVYIRVHMFFYVKPGFVADKEVNASMNRKTSFLSLSSDLNSISDFLNTYFFNFLFSFWFLNVLRRLMTTSCIFFLFGFLWNELQTAARAIVQLKSFIKLDFFALAGTTSAVESFQLLFKNGWDEQNKKLSSFCDKNLGLRLTHCRPMTDLK